MKKFEVNGKSKKTIIIAIISVILILCTIIGYAVKNVTKLVSLENNNELANLETKISIIDDGSVDSTYDIICDYESKYPNIIRGYKNNINKGLGTTRNIGLEKCNAEYIIFVDADDYVSTYYIEKLYNKAIMEYFLQAFAF